MTGIYPNKFFSVTLLGLLEVKHDKTLHRSI